MSSRATRPTYGGGKDVSRIEYLSFEGGGGKGLAYLGPLTVMSHPSIGVMKEENGDYVLDTDRIEGISGASAGAITAVLLASGHSLKELYETMTDPRLDNFYDPPGDDWGFVPIVRKGRVGPLNMRRIQGPHSMDGRILGSAYYERSDKGSRVSRGAIGTLGLVGHTPANAILGLSSDPDPVIKHSINHLRGCLRNLFYDYGLFSGCYARTYLAHKIDPNPWDGYEITFDEFFDEYDVDIRLVGSNITKMEPHIFSKDTTPDFKVADAVRISMSFPGVYKPVVIGDPLDDYPVEERNVFPDDEDAFSHLEGVWLDGGATNNNPIHAFTGSDYRLPNGMLGLRLGQHEPNEIDGLFDYLSAIANTLLSVRSDGEIRSEREAQHVVDLPLGELSLTQFSPGKEIIREAVHLSAQESFDYFNMRVRNPRTWVNNRLGM